MFRWNLGNERGENILELAGMLALTAAVLGTSAYVLFFRQSSGAGFTPQQQAYIAAVQTQQADAYIRAIATQRAAAPPPQAPPPPSAPAAPPLAPVEPAAPRASAPSPTIAPRPPAPPPAPSAPPAPPPPPPPPTKPPMATCVGFMVGITSTGVDACNQITQNTSYTAAVRNCVYDIITGTATTSEGKAACVQASLNAGDAYLSDCFLGLSNQSLYGRTSCRQYYGAN